MRVGDYRIVFRVVEDEIRILGIRHRKDIYQKINTRISWYHHQTNLCQSHQTRIANTVANLCFQIVPVLASKPFRYSWSGRPCFSLIPIPHVWRKFSHDIKSLKDRCCIGISITASFPFIKSHAIAEFDDWAVKTSLKSKETEKRSYDGPLWKRPAEMLAHGVL